MLREFDEFVNFCFEHGGTLRSHKAFGEMSRQLREKIAEQESRLTQDAPDGVYNCEVCGQEKCTQPGICDDCLAPPTEFEINHWGDDDDAPLVI